MRCFYSCNNYGFVFITMSLFKYFQRQSSSQSTQEDATGITYHEVQFRDDVHTLSLLAPVESEMGINSAGDDCASNPVQQLSSEDETESDAPPPAAKRVALEASRPLFTLKVMILLLQLSV